MQTYDISHIGSGKGRGYNLNMLVALGGFALD